MDTQQSPLASLAAEALNRTCPSTPAAVPMPTTAALPAPEARQHDYQAPARTKKQERDHIAIEESTNASDVTRQYSSGYATITAQTDLPIDHDPARSVRPPRLQPSFSSLSHSTLADNDSTPPTSSDGPAPQQHNTGFARPSADQEGGRRTVVHTSKDIEMLDRTHMATRTQGSPVKGVFNQGGQLMQSAGQKRTASGVVKGSSESLPTSPREIHPPSHYRQMSNGSGSPRFGDLGSQLRARLTYAMVKVQHGWQAHSLPEVEQLASRRTSPMSPSSATSALQSPVQALVSPRTAMANLSRESSGLSQDSVVDGRTRTETMSSPRANANGFGHDVVPASQQSSRTYASFWRDHSQAQAPNSSNRLVTTPSLAPPALISSRSSNPRRSYPVAPRTPNLPVAKDGSHLSNSSFASPLPATPPQRGEKPTIIRTPSQKAAMEQDAVETLMFLSSPGNSQKPVYGRLPGTPLRGEMSKRVGFADGVEGGESSDDSLPRVNGFTKRSDQRTQEDAIDRMLDDMEDGSSDEELAGPLSRHMRPVVGQT